MLHVGQLAVTLESLTFFGAPQAISSLPGLPLNAKFAFIVAVDPRPHLHA